ncbi:MAG: TonB-dependent receptor [Dysgonamonadaceae bacterium]|jgi:outer membrane cobalamin receptor|nr:TonB-dependent receptor [Dysgonamonadaceae bacterium]
MFLKRTLFAGVCLFTALPAFAQSKPDSTQVLNEVVVVADRYREVIPSQRLSGEKLEALSSFSVADAIRYFSGVQIKDYGGIGGLKTVDIRSMGTNHLGVFYDGIEIGNAQNGTVDLGKFSLDNIEEISLYNGQKSEIFQSAKDFGSAGTVYLRTRRPKFTGDKKTNLISYFRTGSFDLVNPSVLWEQKITKNISSSFNAEYIYSSGKYKFRHTVYYNDGSIANDTTAVRQNGDVHALRLEGGFNGFTGSNGKWHIKGYFYDSEKGLPGAIVGNTWKNWQRQWDRNAFVQGSFQKRLFENYDFQLNIKYSNDYMRYLNPDTVLMLLDNRFSQQEFYVSTANKYSILPNWDLDLSVDYIWNTLDANLVKFPYPTRNTALAVLATAFEWRRWKAQASVLGTFVFENIKKQTMAKPDDKSEYTPAFFLSYKPLKHENLNFRAFYKRIFRMPTFNDLYYTDFVSIKLRPEYTTQYNIGFQYEKQFKKGIVGYLNFRSDAYYNEVIDKIVATPKGGSGSGSLNRWQMENLGYVEIRGVDVSAQIGWKLPADVQINTNLNYTYQKAQNFTPPKNEEQEKWYGGQINYIPWHSGSMIVNIVRRSWDLNYSFIYVGERYHNSANIPKNHELPWYTSDLTLGKSFHYKNTKFKLSAEVNNILNQQFEVITCYPMPGRNFKVILKLDI